MAMVCLYLSTMTAVSDSIDNIDPPLHCNSSCPACIMVDMYTFASLCSMCISNRWFIPRGMQILCRQTHIIYNSQKQHWAVQVTVGCYILLTLTKPQKWSSYGSRSWYMVLQLLAYILVGRYQISNATI